MRPFQKVEQTSGRSISGGAMPFVTSQETDELERHKLLFNLTPCMGPFELSNLTVLAISSRKLMCASYKLTALCRP